MSNKSTATVATMGIDIGKNSFHVVGLDRRGAIVLRQKRSRGQIEARRRVTTTANMSARHQKPAVLLRCRALVLRAITSHPHSVAQQTDVVISCPSRHQHGLSAVTRTDLELATDFVHRWGALSKDRRARLSKQILRIGRVTLSSALRLEPEYCWALEHVGNRAERCCQGGINDERALA